jgi:hypothetical protein
VRAARLRPQCALLAAITTGVETYSAIINALDMHGSAIDRKGPQQELNGGDRSGESNVRGAASHRKHSIIPVA